MLHYILRRLFWLAPTLLAMSLLTFAIMHATPGSPLQPTAPGANPLSPEAQRQLEQLYGLDRPLHEQYVIFLAKALRLDFGLSFEYRSRPVTEIIGNGFPVSLHLGTMALLIAVAGGVALGAVAALGRNGPVDYLCTLTAMIGVAIPNFVLAVFLIVCFVLLLPIVPRTGGWETPQDWLLPTLALALGPLGIIARYTRSGVSEALRADYVRTARAKGLALRAVVNRHVLKNALIPLVTVIGPMFAAVGTGTFFVESIFRVPGIGRYFVQSMLARDYPMIMGIVLLYGVFLATMNLVVDVLYAVIDPRIRYS
jgi:ABC-type dipeptide/oligopeptide/nickel transport system permease component